MLTWLAGWLQRDRARLARLVEARRHREQTLRTPPQRTSYASGGVIPGGGVTARLAPDECLVQVRQREPLRLRCVRADHDCVIRRQEAAETSARTSA